MNYDYEAKGDYVWLEARQTEEITVKIILLNGKLPEGKYFLFVVSVGPEVKDIKVGDKVFTDNRLLIGEIKHEKRSFVVFPRRGILGVLKELPEVGDENVN